jgi:FkbH-like protein
MIQPGPVTEQWRSFRLDFSTTSDYSRLVRLARRGEQLAERPAIGSLMPLRLAVLSDSTVDFLLPVLKGALLATGFHPSVHVAPYGQVTTSLLDANGATLESRPQVAVVVNTVQQMPGWPELTDSLADVERRVDEVCDALLDPCAIFHERTGAEVVVNNFHPLPCRSSGNLAAKLPGDPVNFVRRVNLALGDRAPRYVHIVDVASLAEASGLATWFDERYWHVAKQAVSFECVPGYCRSLAALIGAIFGRTKKCLVVDLDNTLWGGVIGDDGLGGIHIGEGSADGEAFKAFQVYLHQLRRRGVLLAVCSKNDDRIARSAFVEHPDMVLRLDDFAAFRANWQPKSENVRSIAKELNLPLDTLVFVDDNPAERDEVARALPEVTVIDLPEDPAAFARAVDARRLFEIASLTSEDLRRTETYRVRQQSREVQAEATDPRAYLASLQMLASIQPFDAISLERITQLVNKTNQFNLTTPRMIPAEIARLAGDPACFTRTVRLRDRFGDHGLISVLFGHVDGVDLVIDAWLMSCRVLGRGVEHLLFNHVLDAARQRGLKAIVGWYKPTERNALVKDLYASLGFRPDGSRDGAVLWRLDVEAATPFETFIEAQEPALSA